MCIVIGTITKMRASEKIMSDRGMFPLSKGLRYIGYEKPKKTDSGKTE